MIVSVHQPNYLPWLGYFYKIYASDVFVFHDAVAFSKSSFTKRSRIRRAKTAAETTWLSVPVGAHPTGTLISDVLINNSVRWNEQHWRKIENTYGSAPYFKPYAPILSEALMESAKMSHLAACNRHLIYTVCDLLGIRKEFATSGDMEIRERGSDFNLAIVQRLKGSVYLAGGGSRKYESADAFSDAGIKLVRHDIGAWLAAHPYGQGTAVFVNGLSVIDALMHIGAEQIVDLFRTYKNQAG